MAVRPLPPGTRALVPAASWGVSSRRAWPDGLKPENQCESWEESQEKGEPEGTLEGAAWGPVLQIQ